MIRKLMAVILALTFSAIFTQSTVAGPLRSSLGDLRITRIADGLAEPWGIAFLPSGGFLITERGGELLHFDAAGNRQSVGGVPSVYAKGQGGLLDVVVAKDFAASRRIFLTFSKRLRGGAGTALASAKLRDDGKRLEELQVLFEMDRGARGNRHFGSRVVETGDGNLFLTLGERGAADQAQDLGRHQGKVVRLTRNGNVPAGNPFVGIKGALPQIWSYGHRNPQGAALDRSGQLWVVEHGPKGGDEVNLIRPGRNYGWPVIGYGVHYSGAKVGVGTAKDGMEQPAYYWDPSIAPSGLMIYSGKLWPDWRGDIFVGSLKFDHIVRLNRNGNQLNFGEKLIGPEFRRVRDVREAPDGSIWFLSVDDGAVYRITP
ncbi:MAG: PQQ-dependent sugar dehydrogenase [Rhodobacteraceae bacterium]|nr:PQQ-dependent sugar dehydrogenase [Paracoccaceae bacterium]